MSSRNLQNLPMLPTGQASPVHSWGVRCHTCPHFPDEQTEAQRRASRCHTSSQKHNLVLHSPSPLPSPGGTPFLPVCTLASPLPSNSGSPPLPAPGAQAEAAAVPSVRPPGPPQVFSSCNLIKNTLAA